MPKKAFGSKQITAYQRPIKQNSKESYEWILSDYQNMEGQVIEMYRDRKYSLEPAVNQQILFLDNYGNREAALIKKLNAYSNLRKFQSTDFQRRYDIAFKNYLELLNKYGGASESEIKKLALSSALESPGVEIGAWVVQTRSGHTYTAIHTSGHSAEISLEATSNSINQLMQSKQIKVDEIINISYFHTHPNKGPLSFGDQEMAVEVMSALKSQGVLVPFHLYAISRFADMIITFHAGYLIGE